jgi:glutathione S-transferase
MPQYKLIYFDARGVAEPIRWILHYAGVPFEDVRLPIGSLTTEKKVEMGLEWGQVPAFEVDGRKFAQSGAMGRYLARKYNLLGKDEFEAFKIEEIVDAVSDYTKLWYAVWTAPDETKKAEVIKKIADVDTPVHFERFNKLLERNGGQWFVGNSPSYADFVVAHFATTYAKGFGADMKLGNYPAIQKLVQNVENLKGIKEWIAKRPD